MKNYIIYTDGSHFKGKGSGRLGIGGVLVDPEGVGIYGKEVGSFSEEITQEWIKLTYGTSDCSNPTMEIYAILVALQTFLSKIKGAKIVCKADYLGVSKWLCGEWKINKPYIRQIHTEILSLVRKNNLDITFEWVKGHQTKGTNTSDSHWNDIVDKLSKGEI